VGCPPEIPVTGERKNIKILGAIELWRTRFDYRQDTVFNAPAYLGFLEQLARRYRRQGAILIQDNASYHKDAEVWAWFKSNRHWLEVHQLPPYSPELNPTERLWQHTPKNGTHNRFFGGPDARHYRFKQAAAFQLRITSSTDLYSLGSFACSRLSWRRSFNSLLGRKVAFWLAAICILSPVAGLRPVRALVTFASKMPKPRSSTRSPEANALDALSRIASKIRSTSLFV